MKGFDRLLILREQNLDRAERMEVMRPRFLEMAQRHELGTAPRAVIGFNLFQTPCPIAAMMAERLRQRVREGGRILEPSVGLGRLREALADMRAHWEMVEESMECCNALRKALKGMEVRQRDFLTVTAGELGGKFSGIIMNPPFKNGRDIKHIRHALDMLDTKGRLVSLCYNGPKQRAALKPIAAEWIDLPPNSFREEGTGADVSLVVIDK